MNIDAGFTKFGRDMNCWFNDKIYKLKDLPNDALYYYLSQDISFLTKKDEKDWFNIFRSELQFRRKEKIKKIINNIQS